MKSLPLYVSRDHYYDWLIALEFGRVLDGQPGDHFLPVDESCAFVLDGPGGVVIGLWVGDLRDYDPAAPGSEALWRGPRFGVPLFGLRDAYAGEVILAAQASLRDESTMNRCYFDLAVGEEPEEAIKTWRLCLESGDSMAHYGLGSTLLALNRPREAYRHLRAYVDVARWSAWAWCLLGRACVELGEREEAVDALMRARALEGEDETDAEQLLASLAPNGS